MASTGDQLSIKSAGQILVEESRQAIDALNSATLVQRFSRLEQARLVRKTVRSTMPPRTTYELTESGRALEPVIDALARWAELYGVEEPRGRG